MTVHRHDRLPALRLKGTDGRKHDLHAEHRGRNLLIYLFPDDKDAAVPEVDTFDRYRRAFERVDTDVVGISNGPLHTEKRLARQNGLRHLLLADRRHKAAERLGAWDANKHRITPTAILVDRDGRVEKVYRGLDSNHVSGTAQRVLHHLKSIEWRSGWQGRGNPPEPASGSTPAFGPRAAGSSTPT